MKLSIRHRLPELRDQVQKIPGLADKAARVAMVNTIPKARAEVYAVMRRVFDRPTPYTLGSLRIEAPADAGPIAGAVMVKGRADAAGSGIPAESFLRAEILGGSRRWKRFEVALMRAGHLPRGWYATPTRYARVDQYGNMSRGQIVELMAWLALFRTARGERTGGYRANKTERSKARARAGTRNRFGTDVFVSSPLQAYRRGSLPFGIYTRQTNVRTKRAHGAPAPVRPVVLFVKSASYGVRLDFFGELKRFTAASVPIELDRALARVRAGAQLKDVR